MKKGYKNQELEKSIKILWGGVKPSKERYRKPEVEIVRFEAEDMAMLVTGSGGVSGTIPGWTDGSWD